jgi:hypothetical protein
MEELISGCGLSVEPGNPADLAAAMKTLMEDESLLAEFRANCLAAKKNFEAGTILEGLFRRIEGLTGVH